MRLRRDVGSRWGAQTGAQRGWHGGLPPHPAHAHRTVAAEGGKSNLERRGLLEIRAWKSRRGLFLETHTLNHSTKRHLFAAAQEATHPIQKWPRARPLLQTRPSSPSPKRDLPPRPQKPPQAETPDQKDRRLDAGGLGRRRITPHASPSKLASAPPSSPSPPCAAATCRRTRPSARPTSRTAQRHPRAHPSLDSQGALARHTLQAKSSGACVGWGRVDAGQGECGRRGGRGGGRGAGG